MRYIRQELFIGKGGQEKIRNGSVVIVGMGALGSVSAELLARAGIGGLVLIDRDVVELSNLQRQSLFGENDIGKPKAVAAKAKLNQINSKVKIDFYADDLNFESISDLISLKTRLILDCTDNMQTRFLINDFSVKNNIPFIYSSAIGSKGYVFDVIPAKSACLRCFLKEGAQLETCETSGVLNSITHLISSVQSNEAIKILVGDSYEKNLLFFNVWKNEMAKINVNKNKDCICCKKHDFEYLEGKKFSKIIKMCGHGVYQIKTKKISKAQFTLLKNNLKRAGKTNDFGHCISFENKITIFEDGRALIRAKDEKEAKSIHSKFAGH